VAKKPIKKVAKKTAKKPPKFQRGYREEPKKAPKKAPKFRLGSRMEPIKKVGPELVRCVLNVVDRGLINGAGSGKPGDMCVEQAVAYAMGEMQETNEYDSTLEAWKIGKSDIPVDAPSCVDKRVRDLKIDFNDRLPWKGNKERAAGLREIAVLQLGSNKLNSYSFESIFEERIAALFARYLLECEVLEKARLQPLLALLAQCDGDREEVRRLMEYAVESSDLSGVCADIDDAASTCDDYIERGINRKRAIKETIACACQVLRELKSPGAKLWDSLPPSVRNKKILANW
jgi:hypothetical protein